MERLPLTLTTTIMIDNEVLKKNIINENEKKYLTKNDTKTQT